MNHDEFVGQVQHRAQLPSPGDAEAAIRATFETLGERLLPRAAAHVAAQLPREIAIHLQDRKFEQLSVDDFCLRVAEREHADVANAVFHAQCVYDTMRNAISHGTVRKVERQLPAEIVTLLRPLEG